MIRYRSFDQRPPAKRAFSLAAESLPATPDASTTFQSRFTVMCYTARLVAPL